MAINIDTVYQKVLTFANKEQRGYVTPQEFNLFADQAQMEIFEQYFYDVNQFGRLPGNNTGHSDPITNLEEKINIFQRFDRTVHVVGSSSAVDLEAIPEFYRLTTVRVIYDKNNNSNGSSLYGANEGAVTAEELSINEFNKYGDSPLGVWTKSRPVYITQSADPVISRVISVYPQVSNNIAVDCILVSYIKKPSKPNWSYVVINGNALWDPSKKVDFELHPAEESELVYKILKFAGFSMKRQDLAGSAQSMETMQVQQEKK